MLKYGHTIRLGNGLKCTSKRTGLTCRNAGGHGGGIDPVGGFALGCLPGFVLMGIGVAAFAQSITSYLDELRTTQRYPIYRALKHPLYPILRKVERLGENVDQAKAASRDYVLEMERDGKCR